MTTFTGIDLRAALSLLVDQDCLLPSAWLLVCTVNAACPAARSLLSFQQFVTGSLNATLARLCLFRIIDPADELIPAKRREVFPLRQDFRIRAHCCLKVFTRFVDRAMEKIVCHQTSGQVHLSRIHRHRKERQLPILTTGTRNVHQKVASEYKTGRSRVATIGSQAVMRRCSAQSDGDHGRFSPLTAYLGDSPSHRDTAA
ncbi:hypothetical protein Q0601_16000 [Paracoccus onubensis]|nr:hypothetical protein [Paracoccus onubensis]MDP0928687.1 hypothetical protein [Paracoccus onubensis]